MKKITCWALLLLFAGSLVSCFSGHKSQPWHPGKHSKVVNPAEQKA